MDDVIRDPGIQIDSKLVKAAKDECQSLDLSTSAAFKTFDPKNFEYCLRIIEDVKKKRVVRTRSVHVTLPGPAYRLHSPCIVIPIKTKGLPSGVIYQGKNISLNWEAGKAWEILKDVTPASVQEGQKGEDRGGIWVILYL